MNYSFFDVHTCIIIWSSATPCRNAITIDRLSLRVSLTKWKLLTVFILISVEQAYNEFLNNYVGRLIEQTDCIVLLHFFSIVTGITITTIIFFPLFIINIVI